MLLIIFPLGFLEFADVSSLFAIGLISDRAVCDGNRMVRYAWDGAHALD